MKIALALAAALSLASMSNAHAAADPRALPDNLEVVCPHTSGQKPLLRDLGSGNLYPITDPSTRAIAAKSCDTEATVLGGIASPGVDVTVTNSRSEPIFVSFTMQNGQPGPITWAFTTGCSVSGVGVMIAANTSCAAVVPPAASVSRFCASRASAPSNCWNAQANHQTMVETNFEDSTAPGCFNKGAPCVWYDISVIPSTCTDSAWATNQCAGTGGASYNLPVAVACGGTTTFSCAGPVNSTYGSEQYPSTCGNPNAQCTSSSQSCVNAYFFPMFTGTPAKYQPNVPCLSGQTFGINFLAGQ